MTDDPAKAKQLSKKYCIGPVYSYQDYEHLVNSGEVDAVYIALPTICIAIIPSRLRIAGIHVLCEKPMGYV